MDESNEIIDENDNAENIGEKPPIIRRDPSYLKPGSAFVASLLRKIPGFDPQLSQLISNWGTIIGYPMAQYCMPEKISYRGRDKNCGVLQLRASGSAALELQHRATQICQKINQFFGFKLIESLQFIQSPVATKLSSSRFAAMSCNITANPANDHDPAVLQSVAKIENEQLRASLLALGDHIFAEKSA